MQWDVPAIIVAYGIITALNAALLQMFTPAPHTWKLLSFSLPPSSVFPSMLYSWIMWYVVFSDRLLSLSTIYFIFLSVFPWLHNLFAFLLNKIHCLNAIWFICPSTYGRVSWIVVNHVVLDIYVQVLCECKISTSLGKCQGIWWSDHKVRLFLVL